MKIVDMHCDTISEIYHRHREGRDCSLLKNDLHIDLERMEKGDYLLQNFALFTRLRDTDRPFEYAMKLADTFFTEMEPLKTRIGVVTDWAGIEKNRELGRISALLTVEEGGVCQGNLEFLRIFYHLGVRMMTLTWNFPNELGYPNLQIPDPDHPEGKPRMAVDTEHGLTEKGIDFVRAMEEMGMIIDISHLNDAGIWDVFRYTRKPFVASHSNARALAGHPRNLTDEMIRALANRGGVAGINFSAAFLKNQEADGRIPTYSRMTDMVRHMKHMKQVGGMDCIGLGSDFDGISSTLEMGGCEGMPLLADEMSRQGFTDGEIEKVFSQNVLRVYRELLS
ncbi:MAG: dipeptidase [Clostridiales bacterium]|nr:dipeptidase [Clostridiales bacterium]